MHPMKSRTVQEQGAPGALSFEEAVPFEVADRLREYYLPWLERAVAEVNDELIWRRPHEGTNSIGNLLLHLEGNLRQWVVHGIGAEPDIRTRDREFATDRGPSAEELLENLRGTVQRACEVILQPRPTQEWLEPRRIQNMETHALHAIMHAMEHFAYHTGQIVTLVKSATGRDLGFYNL